MALKPTKLPDKPHARLEKSDNDPLLSEIAGDLLNADKSGPAAEKQLADFINNLWSKKLPDSKLKDKSANELFTPGELRDSRNTAG